MILPVTEVDTIKHIQKAQNSHISAFESIFERLDRQDRERKEKSKNERHKAKILRKRTEKRRKAEANKRIEAKKRHDEESRVKRQSEIDAAAKQNNSGYTSGVREEAERSNTSNATERTQQPNDIGAIRVLGSTWAEVSPQQAAAYMASKTGVAQSVWEGVIYRESSNNPTIVNSIGCFGYLQLHPIHGASSTWTPQQYLDKAVEIYLTAGAGSWEAW